MSSAPFPAPRLTSAPARPTSPVNSKAEIKIAYIGGGSREWATKLLSDLALSDKLFGTVDLYDIDFNASLHNEKLADAVFSHPDALTNFKTRAVKTLSEALRGADFVVISIEPGPITLRYADLEIPAKYGLLQTVGDTTGPGGILRAMRMASMYEKLLDAIMEHCPDAWVINYTNPMSLCVSVIFDKAPQIKAFGCCHEVFGTQKMLAEKVRDWFDVSLPARNEIELDIAGVNHFTWATKITWQGENLIPRLQSLVKSDSCFDSREKESEAAKRSQKWFQSHSLIALDLLRRFGALGAAGDRHLAEFVPWYLTSEKELHRWGVIVTPYTWRVSRSQGPRLSPESISQDKLQPSGEEGVQQIEALLGLRALTTNINLPNSGQMIDLPKGTIVETYAEFRQNSIRPIVSGALPVGAAELVRRVAAEQAMVMQAIRERDSDLAFQALLSDSLVKMPTDRAHAMFREMMDVSREFLLDWR